MTSFNILGCCVSREAFNAQVGLKHTVEGYVQRNFMCDLFTDLGRHIDDSDVHDYFVHAFDRRSFCTIINGDGKEKLLNRKGEWIVIDTFYTGEDTVGKITAPDGTVKYVHTDMMDFVERCINSNAKFKNYTFEKICALENYPLDFENIVHFTFN